MHSTAQHDIIQHSTKHAGLIFATKLLLLPRLLLTPGRAMPRKLGCLKSSQGYESNRCQRIVGWASVTPPRVGQISKPVDPLTMPHPKCSCECQRVSIMTGVIGMSFSCVFGLRVTRLVWWWPKDKYLLNLTYVSQAGVAKGPSKPATDKAALITDHISLRRPRVVPSCSDS